jgi:hypothetical protein
MGNGSLSAVSLRMRAQKPRSALRQEGTDAIEARKARQVQAVLEDAKAITFKQAAERCINSSGVMHKLKTSRPEKCQARFAMEEHAFNLRVSWGALSAR